MSQPCATDRVSTGIHLLSVGRGDPVLFLHGMPTSCRLWDRVTEELSDHFTCLAIDLPGLGRTPPLPGGFRHLDALAASIEALRIERGIESWHVVGHDAGCAIGVEYAYRYPECVGCLALLTPSIFPDLKPFPMFEVLRKPVVGEMMAPAVNLLFWNLVMRLALEDDSPELRPRREVVRDFHAPFRGLGGAWRLMSLLRWGKPAEVLGSMPGRLSDLLVPTLIFHGKKDAAVPPAFATRAASLIPDSEVILLDAGHFLPMTEASVISRELVRFFSSRSRIEPGYAATVAN